MTATNPTPLDAAAIPNADPEPDASGDEALHSDALVILHDLIVQACPDTVPELIQGDDAAAMLASIPAARAAFARVAEAVTSPQPAPAAPAATPPPVPIPAGNAIRTFHLDPATLSPLAKIRHGLARDQGPGTRD